MNRESIMVGNDNQLLKARRIAFREGLSAGIQAIELENRDGLYASIIEDQCLNVYDFSFKGINCAFQGKNGLVSNKYFNGGTNEFSYYWPAGMMYTCGLANCGEPVTEDGIFHPQHGRIGMMSAENVVLERSQDGAWITGTVRDGLVCGHNLELKRKIFFPAKGKEIRICDTVTNLEGIDTDMMILYHCNFGYPLLAPGAKMVKGAGEISDPLGSAFHCEDCDKITEPLNVKDEEVYCHTNTPDEEGFGWAAVINQALDLGCYVKYKMDTLPLLMQWKNFCSNDYAMGLEPANCYNLGRSKEREHKTLPVLKPYESRNFEIAIGILEGSQEISDFERKIR